MRLTKGAITNLIANYKSVLTKMFAHNRTACKKKAAALLACLFIVASAPVMAETYTVDGEVGGTGPAYENLDELAQDATLDEDSSIEFVPANGVAGADNPQNLANALTLADDVVITLINSLANDLEISPALLAGAGSFIDTAGNDLTLIVSDALGKKGVIVSGFDASAIDGIGKKVTIGEAGNEGELTFRANEKTMVDGTSGGGGAIVAADVEIAGGVNRFEGNTVTAGTTASDEARGGAIYATNAVDIKDGTTIFDGNKVKFDAAGDSTDGKGGAIYAGGDVTFSGVDTTVGFYGNGTIDNNNGGGDIETASTVYVAGTGDFVLEDGVTLRGHGDFETLAGDIDFKNSTIVLEETFGNEDGTETMTLISGNDIKFDNMTLKGSGELAAGMGNVIAINDSIADGTTSFGLKADIGSAKEVTISAELDGSGSLVKTGSGTLILNANNTDDDGTFSGDINIDEGTLVAANAKALGTGAVTIGNSTTHTDGTIAFDGAYTITNNVTLNGLATIDTDNHDVTLETGVIDGSGSLVKIGDGSLTLTGNNTYVGGTNINGGSIVLNDTSVNGGVVTSLGDGTVDIAALAKLTLTLTGTDEFANKISGAATSIIDITTHASELILSGDNSGYFGDINLGDGKTLTAASTYALGTGTAGIGGANGIITMGEDAVLKFDGTGAVSSFVVGKDIILGATSATFNVDGADDTVNATINGVIDDGTNGYVLTKTGNGTLTLNGDNTYSGGTELEAGRINAGSNTALGDSAGVLTMHAGTTLGFVANGLNIGNDITVDTGDSATVDTNGHNAILSGIVTVGGTETLVKDGAGTLTLANFDNNSYAGTLQIDSGTLAIAADISPTTLNLGTVNNNSQLNFIGWNNGAKSYYEKDIAIGSYTGNSSGGSDTIGLQASIMSGRQWSDWVGFTSFTAGDNGTFVNFDFEPGSNAKYLNAEGLEFAYLGGGFTNGDITLNPANSRLGVYDLYLDFVNNGDPNDTYVLKSRFNSGAAKVYSETAAAGLAQATSMHGRELFDGTATAARDGVFVGYGHSDLRHETGSHADIKGNNIAVALGFQASEKTAWGFFGQMFKGSYDTDAGNGINSNGDLDAHDFGLFVEYRPGGKTEDGSGRYYKGIVKAGRTSSDFRSDIGGSSPTTFSMGRNVFGLSIGGGSLKVLDANRSTDLYAHLIYTGLSSGDTIDSVGNDVSFGSSNSFRVLTGARLNFNKAKKTSLYTGAALDYEMSGTSEAFVNGNKADKADANGLTGILEFGVVAKPTSNLAIDLGLQGYVGKKQGLGGKLTISRLF